MLLFVTVVMRESSHFVLVTKIIQSHSVILFMHQMLKQYFLLQCKTEIYLFIYLFIAVASEIISQKINSHFLCINSASFRFEIYLRWSPDWNTPFTHGTWLTPCKKKVICKKEIHYLFCFILFWSHVHPGQIYTSSKNIQQMRKKWQKIIIKTDNFS